MNAIRITAVCLLVLSPLLITTSAEAAKQKFEEGDRVSFLSLENKSFSQDDTPRYRISFTMPRVDNKTVILEVENGWENWTWISDDKSEEGFSFGSLDQSLPGKTVPAALLKWGRAEYNSNGKKGTAKIVGAGKGKGGNRWLARTTPVFTEIDEADMMVLSPKLVGKNIFGKKAFFGYDIPVSALGYKNARLMAKTLKLTKVK